jgi:hypothetical protein
VSDTISLPFEAGNAVGSLLDLSVLVDGKGYRGSIPQIAPGINGTLAVDTIFLENGSHSFQIEGSWINPDTLDKNNYALQQFSSQFTLAVSNVICFPEWEDEVGELGFSAYFAETTCSNTDWKIDIYDVNSNYVQSLTGHTTNGVIESYWNMIDTNGVTRTNGNIDPEFSGIITVGDPVSKKVPPKAAPAQYPDHGQWVIAFQDNFDNYANSNMYYSAIYTMGSVGANFGGAITVFPSDPTNAQTFPLRWSTTNHPNSIATLIKDVEAFKSLLAEDASRNLYYCGHGTENSMAGYIDADYLQYALLGNKDQAHPKHYYRFVFLDGCKTANGSLPAAFGINFNSPKPLSYFQKHGIRPRTFLGNTISVMWAYPGAYTDPQTHITYDGRIPPEVPEFLSNFEFYWYYNYDVSSAVYYAIQDTPDIGPGWDTGDYLQVSGYQWLRVDDYNRKTDWSN